MNRAITTKELESLIQDVLDNAKTKPMSDGQVDLLKELVERLENERNEHNDN